jgi:hypothetical protein
MNLIYEKQVYSQHGEDGILEYLEQFVKDTTKTFLEIGWGTGEQNCCRNLLENHNYTGTGIDTRPSKIVHPKLTTHAQWVSIQDAEWLASLQGLEPTVFSLDIDSFDWHLLNRLLDIGFKPKIICHEYNSIIGPEIAVTRGIGVAYNKCHLYGASLPAYAKLLSKDYTFVTVDSTGVNAFWIRNDQQFTLPEETHSFKFFRKAKEAIYDHGIEQFLNQDKGWQYV